MNMLKVAALLLILAPALAIAGEPVKQSLLVVPGVMTSAGQKFANQCSDAAFSRSQEQAGLAGKCEKLLTRWRYEADMRWERRSNPRLIAVVKPVDTQASLPFDTVAALRGDPFAGFSAAR